jgi:Tfp pilus assembly protein PilZ
MPCFVFVNHLAENQNGRDFTLNLSNGTAFIDTHTALSAGQKVSLLFPSGNGAGPTEIMGEVIWINSASLDE